MGDDQERAVGAFRRARALSGAAAADGVVVAVEGLCPFLVAVDGEWRALSAMREHRCTATDPASAVSGDKQRRLCLSAAHSTCATFQASNDLRAIPAARLDAGDPAPRPVVATAPVLLDGGTTTRLPRFLGDRRAAQLGLVLLMTLALAAIVYARAIAPGTAGDARTGTPLPTVPAVASAASTTPVSSTSVQPSPSPAASTSHAPSPSASRAPTPSPTASVSAPPARTYTVRAGDTLISIAARFGTTPATLRTINHLADPRILRVGQVLILP